ncbi:Wzz/FepE/Etk N-terminal domain-containing protein [Alteromonas sp. a30]|uniref:Wzz/FepE/Etk N-terminal domain-containing protein n=1 Tax=Alteromonas sp. a30 TaxID=2730917 RepID=UPI002280872D|nr:Wzz/FepE/Etk N-terminal domain-containing protein [Alteromonas sp. a30]MCY7296203.1 LPS O-antigen length regulator [Alteromonas sp. a30]
MDQNFITQNSQSEDNSSIDLGVLISYIWKKKLSIFAFAAFSAIISIIYALSLSDQYKSSAILMSTSSTSSPSLSNLGGLGGIASLAGLSLGGMQDGDKSTIAIELIQTWGFIEKFIQDNQLEAEVFALEGWDKENNIPIYNDDIYNVKENTWLPDPDGDENETLKPTSWLLYEAIMERINISKDEETGFITVSVEHFSPYVAKKWVDLLVSAINDELKMREISETNKKIRYLEEQTEKTHVAEMRNIFFELIKEQTQTLMLAEVSQEYALKTLSPAKVAEKKSKPFRAVIVILTTFLGAMLGLVVVVVGFIRGTLSK